MGWGSPFTQKELRQRQQTTSPLLVDTLYDAGLLENMHNMVGNSILTYNNKQYAAFFNNLGQIVMRSRTTTPDLGLFGSPVVHTALNVPIAYNTMDTHDYIALGHRNGKLLVAWGMHASPMQVAEASAAESIASFATKSLPLVAGNTTQENSATYPTWLYRSDGLVFFLWRYGSSGNGDHYLYTYDGTNFAAAPGTTAGLIMQFRTTKNAYPCRPFVKNDKMYFFSFKRGPSSAESDNHDVFYFVYDMWTGAATKTNGSAQTLPVTDANCDVIDPVPKTDYLETAYNVSRQQVAVDGYGNVHAVYAKNDSEGNRQLWYLRLRVGQTAWDSPLQLTQERVLGSAVKENHMRPMVLIDSENTIYIFCKPTGATGMVRIYESRDLGNNFGRPYGIHAGAIGMSVLQNMDLALWESKNVLSSVLQTIGSTADDDNGNGFANNPRAVNIFEWHPKLGAKAPAVMVDGVYTTYDLWLASELGDVIIRGGDGGFVEVRSNNSAAFVIRHNSQSAVNPNKLAILRPQPDGVTVSNLMYLVAEQPKTDLNGVVTKAAVLDLDAAFGTHKATKAGTILDTPGTVLGGILVRVNGVYGLIPVVAEANIHA